MVGLPANEPAPVADSPREQLASRAAVTDAFISYSHAKDKPIATALQAVVQKLGKAWLPSSRAAAISPPLADTRPVAAPR